jgi:hydrogenase maturation factor
MSLRLGKLDNDDLERLVLKKFVRVRPEPLSMPAIGQDCATLDIGGDLLVLSCDPITSASIAHLGRLTVHVNCNDAAAAGADPIGLLVTLLVPPSCELDDIARIAGDLSAAAQLAGVDVLGGHTEVTDAVTRPVTSAAVIARQKRGAALPGMRPGDDVVLTKSAAVEGTSIIAEDFSQLLSGVDAETIECARNFSGLLSVVPESKIALDTGAHAMHDVTEGGVLGALWELSFANGCGIAAESDKIRDRRALRRARARSAASHRKRKSSDRLSGRRKNGAYARRVWHTRKRDRPRRRGRKMHAGRQASGRTACGRNLSLV